MADDDDAPRKAKTASKLGPVGEALRRNVKRVRERQGVSQQELSNIVGKLGRKIPPLGIYRIEAGDRRVDVDDLIALAVALDTSPASLLMPQLDSVQSGDPVALTDGGKPLSAKTVWEWLTAQNKVSASSFSGFVDRSWPSWVRERYEAAQRQAFDQMVDEVFPDGDDQ